MKEYGDVSVGRALNMYRCVAVQSIQSVVGGGNIYSAVVTLADIQDVAAHPFFLEIAGEDFAVPAPETVFLCDQPDMIAAVFYDAVYATQVG